MKDNSNVYSVLIYFFIFIAIKKVYDIVMEYNYPTYEDEQLAPKSVHFLFTLRNILAIMSMVFITLIVFSYKLNTYISVLLFLLFIHNIVHFLFEERYIFMFVDKKNIDMNTITLIDGTFNNVSNLIVVFYAFYILLKIFKSS